MIDPVTEHAFRGDRLCLYPGCEFTEEKHSDSADGRPPQPPHWFLGFRLCVGCGIGFNHPSHCFSPAWVRMLFG